MAILLVGCVPRTEAIVLEPNKTSILEINLDNKKEILKEIMEATEASNNEIQKEVVEEPVVEVIKEKPVEKKSNEDIAKEVLSGEWGSGSDRKSKLENAGYNYSEVQALVNGMVPAPPVKKNTSNSSGSSSKPTNPVRVQANNTLMINGYELSISNVNTQAQLDLRRQELVNWGPEYVQHKTVGGGSIYLAVHVDSYGWAVQKVNSITLKDINGNVKTYHRSETYGPVYAGQAAPEYVFSYITGGAGDAIAIQTCVGGFDSTSYVHIFR